MSTTTQWDGAEPARRENAQLLISAEAQAGTLGEIVAWVGLAIWGGALVAFVLYDIAHSYRNHHPALHQPMLHKPLLHKPVLHKRGHQPGRHQDTR
ncbi:hypothetical protein G5C66_18600 [Nocardioides sp. KC13]|uniref:Uncharacterized protein n=1 Tax=Nocardioides turkmenicus TaxID=2711220 RepID=A0A6M1R402_9ACTN|nr:hypothetical protein [Nocardioides sp. KC13]NGN94740.1 hypothetical protein [Nocardioides sp. KC13]